MPNIKIGHHVNFTHRGHPMTGEVIRINVKTMTVELETGRTIRKRAEQLTLVPPKANNILYLPSHMCGRGRRVKFRGPGGLEMTGIVASVTSEEVRVLPDAGPADSWTLPHDQISALEGNLPARSEDSILHEIARCYARLKYGHQGNAPDGEKVRRHIDKRLRSLFRELGHYVHEKDALDWALNQEAEAP